MTSEPVVIRYFAWVRERIGLAEERLTLPETVVTAGDLVGWLAGRGEAYAHAFEAPGTIRVAVDQLHIEQDEPIGTAGEIALFPPMTGG
jgi:molybdopterin synthase sulfur carrier subunit